MSEADSLWYLRHRDGVEHGPFQLVDLVTAAEAGNVAADTCVRHEIHTRAQWVFATRVQAMAQVMAREAQPLTTPAQPRPPQPTNPQPSRQPPAQTNRHANPILPASPGGPESEPSKSIDKNVASTTAIHSHRDAAFPVPKTFVDAVQTLFLDFRFQRFVTPWIIKILWAISLLLAILSIAKLGHDFFIQPSMPEPSEGTGQGNWQFGPMNEQPLLLMRILVFSIAALITSMIVLCIRVVCEIVIVLFLAGGDVRELRKLLKQPRS